MARRPHSKRLAIDPPTMIGRRKGWPRSKRNPSAIDRRIGARSSAVLTGGSGRLILASRPADATNDAASARTANGAEIVWTSRPPSPGPAADDAEWLTWSLPLYS